MHIKKDGYYTLKKEVSEKVYEIKIPVTGEQIENIVVTALEGGIGYWAALDNTKPEWADKPDSMPVSQYAVELLLKGVRLEFSDVEDETIMYLDLDKLLDGIRVTAVKQSWDFDFEEIDSIIADCIFQYGMFGEIIYS